jgi:hypothetical protein
MAGMGLGMMLFSRSIKVQLLLIIVLNFEGPGE